MLIKQASCISKKATNYESHVHGFMRILKHRACFKTNNSLRPMLKYWILCTELFLHAHVFYKVLLKMSDKSAKNPLKMFSRSNLGFVFQKYLAIMGCLHGLNRSHVAWSRFKKTFTSSVFLRHAKGGTPFRFISFIEIKQNTMPHAQRDQTLIWIWMKRTPTFNGL